MKLVQSSGPIVSPTGETWEAFPGHRVLPENDLDRVILTQIWASQCGQNWELDEDFYGDIPWKSEGFKTSIDWDGLHLARSSLVLQRKQITAENPFPEFLPIVVYWIYETNVVPTVKACWSINHNGLCSTNYANLPIIL